MMQRVARTVLAAVFAAALLTPAAAGAAAPPREEQNARRARELKAQAEALYDQPKEWKKVARLLEESAALRPAEDAEKYACLQGAGQIRAALGEMKQAHRLLEAAAETALMRGALVEAADAYLDAAVAAKHAHFNAAALELVQKAMLLSTSPLLSPAEREQVLSRVG